MLDRRRRRLLHRSRAAWRLAAVAAGLGAAALPPASYAQPAASSVQAVQPAAGPLAAVRSVEGITEYRLANGLQLLLVPDAAKPTTTVNLTYRVGSRHENYGETGMAHLLEHLIFKGTPTTPNVWAEFQKRGMRPNGTTWTDRTNYFASFAQNPDTLRWYLGWLADSMVNSFIARKDLDSEMTVVRNEMEMGENSPARQLVERTMSAMYDWHNYGKSTIGARADVENVDIGRLQAFYRKHYQPDNATLVVAGAFDTPQVLAWVQQAFGPLARPARALEPTYTLDAAQNGERTVTVRRAGGAPLLIVGHHVPAAPHPDYAAVQMLGPILGSAPGGRLHKALVDKQLAAEVFAFSFGFAEPTAALVGAQLAPGHSVDAARGALLATLESLGAQPITAEELERARTQWLKAWELGFTNPERVGVALSEAVAQGDWRLFFLQRDRVRAVTLADVQRVATAYLVPDNRTVGTYLPTAEVRRAPAPQRVDVAPMVADYKGDAAVAQAEAFDPTPANLDARAERWKLGDVNVGLLPKGARGNVVRFVLRLPHGDVQSLMHQEFVGAFVGSMFDKGGAGLTRQQIADTLDKLRAQGGVGLDGQATSAMFTTTRQHLPALIRLVGGLLREPAFDARALEEIRAGWLASIEQKRQEPDALVGNTLARHGNPYPRGDLRHVPSFDEEAEAVRAVTLEQVKAYHRRFVSAARGEIAIVGDFDVAAAKAALTEAFGSWTRPAAGALPYARVPEPLVKVAPTRLVLRTPDKANATMAARLALPLNDLHPDYPALTVANHIFGAGGSSRLWKRIRETEGLSYDVRSGFGWSNEDANTRWSASAIFAPQNQPKVEAAFKAELDRSLRDGFSQAELDDAKRSILNGRRLSRAQDDVVAAQLSNNLRLDRRFALSQTIDDAIAALTLEQVNAAWKRHLDAGALVVGWGGDFK